MKVQQQIIDKITQQLSPLHFDIFNESHMHSVPENSETHFKVVIVSKAFEAKRKVARHQLVYSILKDELAGEVHALAIHVYTPEEWSKQPQVSASPNCMGGSKS